MCMSRLKKFISNLLHQSQVIAKIFLIPIAIEIRDQFVQGMS